MSDRLYTVEEFVRELKRRYNISVHDRTVRKWISKDLIHAQRIGERKLYIPETELAVVRSGFERGEFGGELITA